MRIVGPRYDLLYTVWCNNVHELYDMKVSLTSYNDVLQSPLLKH